jgi:hypothetical protein
VTTLYCKICYKATVSVRTIAGVRMVHLFPLWRHSIRAEYVTFCRSESIFRQHKLKTPDCCGLFANSYKMTVQLRPNCHFPFIVKCFNRKYRASGASAPLLLNATAHT